MSQIVIEQKMISHVTSDRSAINEANENGLLTIKMKLICLALDEFTPHVSNSQIHEITWSFTFQEELSFNKNGGCLPSGARQALIRQIIILIRFLSQHNWRRHSSINWTVIMSNFASFFWSRCAWSYLNVVAMITVI